MEDTFGNGDYSSFPENDPYWYIDHLGEDVTDYKQTVVNYDSDRVDSDIEEMLYTSIHHQTIDTQELSFESNKSLCNSHQKDCYNQNGISKDFSTIKPIIYNQRNCVKKEKAKLSKEKLLNALNKLGQSFPKKNGINSNIDYDISYGNDISLKGFDPVSEMNQFYNEDDYDSDEENKMIKSLPSNQRFWRVDSEDVSFRGKRITKGKSIQCRLCFEFGHREQHCSKKVIVCYICGEENHLFSSCKQKTCSICFNTGHLSHQCKMKYSAIQCSICKITGHSDVQCTFHWRKFMTTTSEEEYHCINSSGALRPHKVTVNSNLSCYNCGMYESHFAYECRSLTINKKRFEIPSPVMNLKRKKTFTSSPNESIKPKKRKNVNKEQIVSVNESKRFLNESDDSIDYVLDILKQSDHSPQWSSNNVNKKPKRNNMTINVKDKAKKANGRKDHWNKKKEKKKCQTNSSKQKTKQVNKKCKTKPNKLVDVTKSKKKRRKIKKSN